MSAVAHAPGLRVALVAEVSRAEAKPHGNLRGVTRNVEQSEGLDRAQGRGAQGDRTRWLDK